MFYTVKLKAFNPEQDIDRFYRLHTDQNLFGEYVLTINHGRCGNLGRTRRLYFTEPSIMIEEMRTLIKRRLNAKPRLGVNYRVVSFE